MGFCKNKQCVQVENKTVALSDYNIQLINDVNQTRRELISLKDQLDSMTRSFSEIISILQVNPDGYRVSLEGSMFQLNSTRVIFEYIYEGRLHKCDIELDFQVIKIVTSRTILKRPDRLRVAVSFSAINESNEEITDVKNFDILLDKTVCVEVI